MLEDQALEVKQTAKTIFSEATFQLHKWQSNVQALEAETVTSDEDGQSYAKQQLGVKKGKSKLRRVPWDKKRDEIQVSFPISMAVSTKRGMREKLPKFTTRSDRSQGPNLAGEGIFERAVQHLYPLELSCDKENTQAPVQLDPQAPIFRPRRDSAIAASYRIQDMSDDTF